MPDSEPSLDDLSSDGSYDDDDYRLAQQEWEESIQQLQQLVSMVVLPMLGKFLGRRWSYWGSSASFALIRFAHSFCSFRAVY